MLTSFEDEKGRQKRFIIEEESAFHNAFSRDVRTLVNSKLYWAVTVPRIAALGLVGKPQQANHPRLMRIAGRAAIGLDEIGAKVAYRIRATAAEDSAAFCSVRRIRELRVK